MQRKENEITDRNEIENILSHNIICRIALADENIPYIIPMNYGYASNKIYLHSVTAGKKIDIIKKNNNVCFEITESIEMLKSEHACNFSTKYRSVIGYGKIKIINNIKKKKDALQIIMYQHTKKSNWTFSSVMFAQTVIMEINITSMTGKKSGM